MDSRRSAADNGTLRLALDPQPWWSPWGQNMWAEEFHVQLKDLSEYIRWQQSVIFRLNFYPNCFQSWFVFTKY